MGVFLTPLDASFHLGSIVSYYNIAPIILGTSIYLAFCCVHHANPKPWPAPTIFFGPALDNLRLEFRLKILSDWSSSNLHFQLICKNLLN